MSLTRKVLLITPGAEGVEQALNDAIKDCPPILMLTPATNSASELTHKLDYLNRVASRSAMKGDAVFVSQNNQETLVAQLQKAHLFTLENPTSFSARIRPSISCDIYSDDPTFIRELKTPLSDKIPRGVTVTLKRPSVPAATLQGCAKKRIPNKALNCLYLHDDEYFILRHFLKSKIMKNTPDFIAFNYAEDGRMKDSQLCEALTTNLSTTQIYQEIPSLEALAAKKVKKDLLNYQMDNLENILSWQKINYNRNERTNRDNLARIREKIFSTTWSVGMLSGVYVKNDNDENILISEEAANKLKRANSLLKKIKLIGTTNNNSLRLEYGSALSKSVTQLTKEVQILIEKNIPKKPTTQNTSAFFKPQNSSEQSPCITLTPREKYYKNICLGIYHIIFHTKWDISVGGTVMGDIYGPKKQLANNKARPLTINTVGKNMALMIKAIQKATTSESQDDQSWKKAFDEIFLIGTKASTNSSWFRQEQLQIFYSSFNTKRENKYRQEADNKPDVIHSFRIMPQ